MLRISSLGSDRPTANSVVSTWKSWAAARAGKKPPTSRRLAVKDLRTKNREARMVIDPSENQLETGRRGGARTGARAEKDPCEKRPVREFGSRAGNERRGGQT